MRGRLVRRHRSPVAVFDEADFSPGFSFGGGGEESVHFHHQVAGSEEGRTRVTQSQIHDPSRHTTQQVTPPHLDRFKVAERF